MFTGIILNSGIIDPLERLEWGARLRVVCDFAEPFERGESIAVNGVCLTALPDGDAAFLADVSNETLSLTTLGSLPAGTRVNLERALALGDRLGGHMVQGHVDARGTLTSIPARESSPSIAGAIRQSSPISSSAKAPSPSTASPSRSSSQTTAASRPRSSPRVSAAPTSASLGSGTP
jgi:Riboflavin synthase alpha chain